MVQRQQRRNWMKSRELILSHLTSNDDALLLWWGNDSSVPWDGETRRDKTNPQLKMIWTHACSSLLVDYEDNINNVCEHSSPLLIWFMGSTKRSSIHSFVDRNGSLTSAMTDRPQQSRQSHLFWSIIVITRNISISPPATGCVRKRRPLRTLVGVHSTNNYCATQ